METRANYVTVGIFTIAILIAAFVILYFIARMGETTNNEPLDIRIPGSVSGLGESSQVFFNGIRVGVVRELRLDESNPNMVIAKTEINGSTPITRSTVATLGFQGLTGFAFIELKGGSLNEPNLLEEAKKDDTVARIDADPSTINNLLATAQDIMGRANSAIGELEGFIRDSRGSLIETVNNTREFSRVLYNNSDNITHIMQDSQQMIARLNTASQRVDTIMAKLDTMLSPDNQNSVIVKAKETLKSIQQTADTLKQYIAPIANNLEKFTGKGLRNVESLIQDSHHSVARIEQAISDLERDPSRIIFGGTGSVPLYDGRIRR